MLPVPLLFSQLFTSSSLNSFMFFFLEDFYASVLTVSVQCNIYL